MLSLYLSDDKIRLVECVVKSKKYYIKRLIETESKTGSIETGNIKDVLALSQTIQEMMNDNGIKSQKVNIVLDNSRIVFRETVVPALPPKKLKVILATEFFADGKQKNNCIDYVVDTQFVDEEKKKKYKVYITYQSIDAILSLSKCCKELGLKIGAIDIAQNSTKKLLEEFYKNITATSLLVDYKDSFISLYIFENGQRKYSKSSQINAKPSTGEFGDDEYFVAELNNNINSVCRYYESKNEGVNVDAVYLTGNISVLNDSILQQLSNKCKLTVSYLPCPETIIGVDINDFNKFSCTIGGMLRR